jgi:hypothetical protein
MKLAIMQPYLFPYIGYFQLMNAADEFVVYNNIKYTKKGWINRNRILVNGSDAYINFPLKKDSDYLDIKDRCLAEIWPQERQKLLNKLRESYRSATYFEQAYSVIEKCILFEDMNLFAFILHSLNILKNYLDISTPFVVSSTIEIDNSLKAQDKVMAICKARQAGVYINPIGGVELYNKEDFTKAGIELFFLKTGAITYKQFNNIFVPSLSIIDVMMFNSKEEIKEYLNSFYSLV